MKSVFLQPGREWPHTALVCSALSESLYSVPSLLVMFWNHSMLHFNPDLAYK